MWNQFWHPQRARPLRMPRCRWNARLSCTELPHTVSPWNSVPLDMMNICMQIGQQRDKYACCTCLLRLHCPIRLELVCLLLFLFSRSTLSDSLRPHGLHMPGFSVLHYLPEFAQTHVHWVGDAIQSTNPLLSPSPAAGSSPMSRPFITFSISPSNEYSGLISFRIDWFDLLAVQGTLVSLLQHHSSKPSILQLSSFFTVQLLHPYMTTGKTIALTLQMFVVNVSAFSYDI